VKEHRVDRRVLGSPVPPEVVRHLGKGLVVVVGETPAEHSQPLREARDVLEPEQGGVILTRGQETQHILVEVQRELTLLQTGEAMQALQVGKGLQ